MGYLGSIQNSSVNWNAWLDFLATQGAQYLPNTGSDHSDEAFTTLPLSEKERIESLLQGIPPPYITPALFSTIAADFPNRFSLEQAGGSIAASMPMGTAESAVVLAALAAWAKEINNQNDLVQESLKRKENNPLAVGLELYVRDGGSSGEALSSYALLRNTPLISSTVQTVNPTLAEQAFQIAMGQLVFELLDQWCKYEARRADMVREDEKHREITKLSPLQQLVSSYVDELKKSDSSLTQPAVTLLVSAITGATIASMTTAQVGANAPLTSNIIDESLRVIPPTIVPLDLSQQMSLIAQGLIAVAQQWAMPITLFFLKGREVDAEVLTKSMAHAFTAALTTFIKSESFNRFLAAALNTYAPNCSEKEKKEIEATIKFTLLMASLAVLYKALFGSIKGAELKMLLTNDVQVNDDYLHAVISYCKAELMRLPANKRDKLIDALCFYYENHQNADTLLDPNRAFLALWGKDERLATDEGVTQRG